MTTNTNPGCLASLLSFLNPYRSSMRRIAAQDAKLPYKLRNSILSAAEFSFYKVLQTATQGKYSIQCKVRMADVFYTHYGSNISHFNKITRKHVDFLMCDLLTMKPLLGIELDDASHSQPDRYERDILVDEIYRAANFPVLHIKAQQAYNTEEIANKVKLALTKVN
jgi:hypothetical protein